MYTKDLLFHQYFSNVIPKFQKSVLMKNTFVQFWNPVDTGCKLNVHRTFRRRPGRLLNVLCTFNLRLVSTGKFYDTRIVDFNKKYHS